MGLAFKICKCYYLYIPHLLIPHCTVTLYQRLLEGLFRCSCVCSKPEFDRETANWKSLSMSYKSYIYHTPVVLNSGSAHRDIGVLESWKTLVIVTMNREP